MDVYECDISKIHLFQTVLNVAFGDKTTEEDEQTSVIMLPLARGGGLKGEELCSSPRSKIHNLYLGVEVSHH
jgi:hypothetical protein